MSILTTLAAAEDGLLAALQAAAGLTGVPLRLGDPGSGVRPEHVWIAEEAVVEQVSDVSEGGTAGGREETFELNVRILTTRGGDDFAALRDRATALVQAVEAAVAADRTLGGAVEDCEVSRIERESGATDVGRGILHTVVVTVRSWLA